MRRMIGHGSDERRAYHRIRALHVMMDEDDLRLRVHFVTEGRIPATCIRAASRRSWPVGKRDLRIGE